MNVVLFWLQDLASEQRRQCRPRDAAESLRKAVLYMASDKGEPLALVRCGLGDRDWDIEGEFCDS